MPSPIEQRVLSNKRNTSKSKMRNYQKRTRLKPKRAMKRRLCTVCDNYKSDIESKRSANRQRYQEDLKENRAAKRQKYENNSAAIKASKRSRYWNDPNAVRLARRIPYPTRPDLKRAAEKTRYHRGLRTTTTTQR